MDVEGVLFVYIKPNPEPNGTMQVMWLCHKTLWRWVFSQRRSPFFVCDAVYFAVRYAASWRCTVTAIYRLHTRTAHLTHFRNYMVLKI
jgi:hypothetical protein